MSANLYGAAAVDLVRLQDIIRRDGWINNKSEPDPIGAEVLRELCAPRTIGHDQDAITAGQPVVHRLNDLIGSFHDCSQQSGGFAMGLLRVAVRQETGFFKIEQMNLRRLRARSAKGCFAKNGVNAATDQDAIKLLPAGASRKLAKVDLGIASEKKDGRGDRQNQLLGNDRKRLSAVTEKYSPVRRHA
jgi:hypothetical protein